MVIALVLASLLFTMGGIAMKESQGFQFLTPTILVFVLFSIAAALQTWVLNFTDLSKGYVYVLGLEAIFSILAGFIFFNEPISLLKAAGAGLVISGIFLLKFS